MALGDQVSPWRFCVMQLVRLTCGQPSPYDGLWLVEYAPWQMGVDPLGRRISARIIATRDVSQARVFRSTREARTYWRMPSGRVLPNGMPDRPLTAFLIAIEPAP